MPLGSKDHISLKIAQGSKLIHSPITSYCIHLLTKGISIARKIQHQSMMPIPLSFVLNFAYKTLLFILSKSAKFGSCY